MTSISTPTPMNETMRSRPLSCEKSTSASLTTTTPIKAAPIIHSTRREMRVAITINASANKNQNSFYFDGSAVEKGGSEAMIAGSQRGTGSGSVIVYAPAITNQMQSPAGQDCAVIV